MKVKICPRCGISMKWNDFDWICEKCGLQIEATEAELERAVDKEICFILARKFKKGE